MGTLTIPEEPEITTEPGRPSDPCVMVIFGGTGDLTKRKLLPALYNLAVDKLLSSSFAVIGIGRTPLSTEEFRSRIDQEVREFATTSVEPQQWKRILSAIYYLSGDLQDPGTYKRLSELLEKVDKDHGTQGNYFYYLATAPNFFGKFFKQRNSFY